MSERDHFLRAIETDPDSDWPRLVYADWLEEHGDPERAEFIRAQCEAYRIRYGPPPRSDQQIGLEELTRMQQLTARAAELLALYKGAWTAELPEWARYVGFQRGFQDFFYFTGKQLVEDAAPIRKVAPLAGYLSLRLARERLAAVFACEHLASITRLDLDGCNLTDASVKLLAKSPHLGTIKELKFSRGYTNPNRLTDAAGKSIAQADNLPLLRRLNISGYDKLTAAGLRAIVEAPQRAALMHLDVSNGPADATFSEMFQSPRWRLTALVSLNVGGRHIGDAAVSALADCPQLASLRELSLHESDLTDVGVRAILDSPHLRNLHSIHLSSNGNITDATARLILSDARRWQRVTIFHTAVSAALLAEVAARCAR